MVPSRAKLTSSFDVQSTLAPASITSTTPSAVGNGEATAARSTPSCNPSMMVAAGQRRAGIAGRDERIDLTGAVQVHARSTSEDLGFLRTAASGSLVHADHVRRVHDVKPVGVDAVMASELRLDDLFATDERDLDVRRNSRKASTAPSTSGAGAPSPPIASSAMRITA